MPLPLPNRRTERWSMDFMVDTLADGCCFWMLYVVDDFTRECVAIQPAQVMAIATPESQPSRPLSHGRRGRHER